VIRSFPLLLVGCAAVPLAPPSDAPEGARTAADDAAILAVANEEPEDVLDVDVGLDSRAAANIVAERPFATIAELDAVSWVGESALAAMLAWSAAADDDSCLIISEVLEASGAYNKAVELTNCGERPARLADHGLCLVRNDDRACTRTATLADVELPPGETWVVCRSLRDHAADPYPWLVERCDEAHAGVVDFNGDDRVLVFRDADGDGAFDADADTALDMLGRMAFRPTWMPWADVDLRRCDPTPYDGVTGTWYDEADFFEPFTRHAYDHLGVPPDSESCD
jgi:hypothetical protein